MSPLGTGTGILVVITMAVVIGIMLELVITIFVVITTFVVITAVDVSMVGTGEVAVVVTVITNSGIVVSTDNCDVTIIALVGTSDADILPSLILGMVIIVFDIITVGMNSMLVAISVDEAFGDDITVFSILELEF